jgi:hypothetical protein
LSGGPPRRGPLVAAVIATVVVGLPWWLYVILTLPNSAMRLQTEMTGIGMPDYPDPWYSYFFIVGYVLPWIAFFVVAIIQFVHRLVHRKYGFEVLAGMLLLVPIVIMGFFRERHDRYLLPMLGPAAILIALALQEHLDHWRKWNAGDRLLVALHWIMIAAAIVLFLLGASLGRVRWMTRLDDGQPWFSQRAAIAMIIAGLALVAFGAVAYLRWRGSLVTITFLIALIAQVIVMRGYVTSETARSGMRDLADAVLARYPDAMAYNAHPLGKRAPSDLGVYLNRQLIWIADPGTLRRGDHPLVLFMLQNRGEPVPKAPAGWIPFNQARKRNDTWHAFVLP